MDTRALKTHFVRQRKKYSTMGGKVMKNLVFKSFGFSIAFCFLLFTGLFAPNQAVGQVWSNEDGTASLSESEIGPTIPRKDTHIWGYVICENGIPLPDIAVLITGYFHYDYPPPFWFEETRTFSTDSDGFYVTDRAICAPGLYCPCRTYEIYLPAYDLWQVIEVDEPSEEVTFIIPGSLDPQCSLFKRHDL
jgi:hypothetical protein